MAGVQSVELSFHDGTRAVELARNAIEAYILQGQRAQLGSMRDAFYTRTGALVRIESAQGRGRLRGCAGTYNGTNQLGHAIVDAAIAAASPDSCGSELEPSELSTSTVSVCIIRSHHTPVDPVAELKLGDHGLVIDGPDHSEWMYPTVPVDNNWTVHEYLERTCRKAGLPPNAWEDDDVTVQLFDGTVFQERDPGGTVEQR